MWLIYIKHRLYLANLQVKPMKSLMVHEGLSLYELLQAEKQASRRRNGEKQHGKKQETEKQHVEKREGEKQEAEKQQPDKSCRTVKSRRDKSGAVKKLEQLLSQNGNKHCADCGSPGPKWVSLGVGVFISIKCSGVHRSLGVHITKVLSVKLDEWTDDQVNSLAEMGGNLAVNQKYEFCVPASIKKPRPESSIDDRSDFIWKKYEMKQFMISDDRLSCPFPQHGGSSHHRQSCKNLALANDRKAINKQACSSLGCSGIGHAFRYSWKRKDSRIVKKTDIQIAPGMIEFVGLIKVNVVKGTNLAIRDVMSSDPYVILSLGGQSVKTRVVRNNLNPVWNEKLMLSVPDSIPPLKLLVYDEDTFSTDDFMGQVEIDIQPLVSAARTYEGSNLSETTEVGKLAASKENTLIRNSLITVMDGKVKQEMAIKLRNVERGVLDLELECLPLTQ